ncbi:MAG: hypothetical protein J1F10_02005 [Muribaculaceae bacterium]|nr:hypothetical protein [Muribaculaceae bacterium]
MRNRLGAYFAWCVCVISSFTAVAQKVEWDIDFNTVFDNREGDRTYNDPKTFLHTQLSPEVGISLMDGTHAIMGGVVWTQPIGCEWTGHRISPTLYYRYKSGSGWAFSFGMFPKLQLLESMPNYIWNDSINYLQRNIRGALIQYSGVKGCFEGVLDWRGMQTDTQREAFNIIVRGEWRPNNLLLAGGLVMMNHYAKQKKPPMGQAIVDNFVINPYVGVNLKSKTLLDSLTIKVGALTGITRHRAEGEWKTPTGVWMEGVVEKKWFGLKETFYYGGRLFPYYDESAWMLHQGEPFYQSKYFSRTQLYGYILRNSFMNLQASLDFNVAQNCFIFYQRLILRIYIDSAIFKHGVWDKNKKLKGIY